MLSDSAEYLLFLAFSFFSSIVSHFPFLLAFSALALYIYIYSCRNLATLSCSFAVVIVRECCLLKTQLVFIVRWDQELLYSAQESTLSHHHHQPCGQDIYSRFVEHQYPFPVYENVTPVRRNPVIGSRPHLLHLYKRMVVEPGCCGFTLFDRWLQITPRGLGLQQ